MDAWAVVVAAGSGSRFGARKQFAVLAGRPVVAWSLAAARGACAGVVLVLPPGDVGPAAGPPPGGGGPGGGWDADVVVAGGATRSASVRAGLDAVPPTVGIVAVHDAARPLARPDLWRAVLEAVAAGADAAVPAVPVTDTIKQVGADGRLVTLDRSGLVAVQTPQAFRAAVLRDAHRAGADATDDAALVEARGGRVVLVDGSPGNLKVTAPHDLVVAGALLEAGS